MLSDFGESHDPLFEFEIAPPVLDPVCRAPLDDHVDRILLQRATEQGGPDILLDHRDVGGAVEKRLKEAQKLLVLICIDGAVVVEDGKQDREDKLDGGTLEDEEVIVLVEEDHLVQKRLLLA